MNREQAKTQLAAMRAKYDADIVHQLSSLLPGEDDRNLAVLKAVQYDQDWLSLLELAAKHVDKVPEVDPAAPAPSPPPPAPVVGGKAGWPHAALEKIIHKKTVR